MKQSKVGGLIVFLVAAFFILSGCQTTNNKQTAEGKLKVVTTFYPMYDFTKQVTGQEAEVKLLIKAGVEPHDYEPSAKDIAEIIDADVFIYSSSDMETWVKQVLENVDQQKTKVIKASAGIKFLETSADEEDEHEHGADEHEHSHSTDPHVWLDPILAKKQVATIAAGLSAKDSKNAATYQKNAATYQKKLAALNTKYQTAFKDAKNKTFVTQHAAFAYLAKQYGLKQVSIVGLSADEEPSPARMAEIQTYIEKNHVQVIYFAETVSSKISETLAQETGIKLAVLNPLEGLSSQEQKEGADYLSVMTENLNALQKSIK